MTTNYLSRPKMVKTFANKAMDSKHLAVRFGTNRLAKDVESIANDNFEYGIESLEGDLQPRDLNSVLKYLSANLTYLFQQGVAEFSPYQNYPLGALAQYDGALWISTKEIEASKHEVTTDPCNPCAIPTDCEVAKFPSEENGWCRLVTYCEYSKDLKALQDKDDALEKAIANLKGVTGFAITANPDTGLFELTLSLSNGQDIRIPMSRFGHIIKNKDGSLSITNADGSTLELPKFVAEKDLDQQKGFRFNEKTEKWEIDLHDLVQQGAGLEVTPEGKLKVKLADVTDGKSLTVDEDGKLKVGDEWKAENIDKPIEKAKEDAINTANTATDNKFKELKEKGAEVYVGQGVSGNGTKEKPLNLKVAEADFGFNGNNELFLKPQIQDVTNKNLNTLADTPALRKLGLTTFYGKINRHGEGDKFTVGFPSAMTDGLVGTKEEVDAANTHAEYKDHNADFTGYQFASPTEVIQVVVDEYPSNEEGTTKVAMYTRAYSAGMDTQGNLNPYEVDINSGMYNVGVWTKWQRVTALPLQGKLLQALNSQVQDLTNKVQGNAQGIAALQDELAKLKARLDVCCKDSTPAPEPSPNTPSNAIRDEWRNYPTGSYSVGLVKSSDILDFENGAKRVTSNLVLNMISRKGFYDDTVNTYTVRSDLVKIVRNAAGREELTRIPPEEAYLIEYRKYNSGTPTSFKVQIDQLRDKEFTLADPLYFSERAEVNTSKSYPRLVGFIAQPAININGENYNIVFADSWLYAPKSNRTVDFNPQPHYPAGLEGVYFDNGGVKSLDDSHNPPVIVNPYLKPTEFGYGNAMVNIKDAKLRFGDHNHAWDAAVSLDRARALGRTWYRNPVAHTHTGWKL